MVFNHAAAICGPHGASQASNVPQRRTISEAVDWYIGEHPPIKRRNKDQANPVNYKRNETYEYFKHNVDAAEKVYALDADLNQPTVNTICNFVRDKTCNVTIVINEREVGEDNHSIK